jgi:hypothetical protein
MSIALSLIATAISLVFASVVYRQFVTRGRPYQLVWSAALLIFGFGTFCQYLAELYGWNSMIYRTWYFTGAMLAAAFLGQGTVYLMASRRVAHRSMAILGVISLVGLYLVATLPVDASKILVDGSVTGSGFPPILLLLLIPLNTYGTVALVGGALISVARFWRSGTMGRHGLGTLLIAVGGICVALGGTANRLGVPGILYLTELVGLAIIFVGYVQTVSRPADESVSRQSVKRGGDSARPSSVHP